MVDIKRVSHPQPESVPYNPYALLPLILNGQEVLARPYQFDSDRAHANTTDNAAGRPVHPTRAVVQCPECCQGLELALPVPCPNPLVVYCSELTQCTRHPASVHQYIPITPPFEFSPPSTPALSQDPFCNPFLEGRMPVLEASTDLLQLLATTRPTTTVAERLGRQITGIEREP